MTLADILATARLVSGNFVDHAEVRTFARSVLDLLGEAQPCGWEAPKVVDATPGLAIEAWIGVPASWTELNVASDDARAFARMLLVAADEADAKLAIAEREGQTHNLGEMVAARDSAQAECERWKEQLATASTLALDQAREVEDLRIKLSLSETREKQATEMCTWLTGENQRLRDERVAGPVCPYRVADGNIVGPNLSVDCGMLLEPERQGDVQAGRAIILEAIADMLNAAFRSGRGDTRIVHGVGCRYHNSGCEGDCDCDALRSKGRAG